jgi:hypothetical protein
LTTECAGFLIDECLSHDLIEIIAARGYHARAVTLNKKLRGRGDHIIFRYSIDENLILVTNNIVDFERIYQENEVHPGLVFFAPSHSKLRKFKYQSLMIQLAIDDIEEEEPIQQVIYISAVSVKGVGVQISTDRYYLPELENCFSAQAAPQAKKGKVS